MLKTIYSFLLWSAIIYQTTNPVFSLDNSTYSYYATNKSKESSSNFYRDITGDKSPYDINVFGKDNLVEIEQVEKQDINLSDLLTVNVYGSHNSLRVIPNPAQELAIYLGSIEYLASSYEVLIRPDSQMESYEHMIYSVGLGTLNIHSPEGKVSISGIF